MNLSRRRLGRLLSVTAAMLGTVSLNTMVTAR